MIVRSVNLSKFQSFFLFGPRGTGKSTLLRRMFPEQDYYWIDLLNPEIETRYLLSPSTMFNDWQMASDQQRTNGWIIIDEIQKVPRLLDVVHLGIENHGLKFAMTGSSARKLRYGGSNLLAGRAVTFELHPFSSLELGNNLVVEDAINYGTLPRSLALRDNPIERKRFLYSYVNTYLREEIQAEGFIRKFEPFRNFLPIAATASGTIINMTKMARQIGINSTTVQRYFSILEDTLLGFYLPSFNRSIRTGYARNPKFYFFDTGVLRAASQNLDNHLTPSTYEFGRLFEHMVLLDILKVSSAAEKHYSFSYLRTERGLEIDVIATRGNELLAIEIKSTTDPDLIDIRKYARLAKSIDGCQPYIFCRTNRPSLQEGVKIVPWRQGVEQLFA